MFREAAQGLLLAVITLHKEVDGVDDPVIGNATLDIVIRSSRFLSTSVGYNKTQPFTIVGSEYLAPRLVHESLFVETVNIEQWFCFSQPACPLGPCEGLRFDVSNIEPLPKVDILAPEVAQRAFYNFCTSVVDFNLAHYLSSSFFRSPINSAVTFSRLSL